MCWRILLLSVIAFPVMAREAWEETCARMPLQTPVLELNRTNCVPLLLDSFQSNATVKALIFMPGATDEFYMFHRARARLTNAAPSMLDALQALASQTEIRLLFRDGFLLLHTAEDPLDPIIQWRNGLGPQSFPQDIRLPELFLFDRDWNYVQPILRRVVKAEVRPWPQSYDSWHFYRHSLRAYNLTPLETILALEMAGKTRVSVRRKWNLFIPQKEVVFTCDPRVRAVPRLTEFPR